MGTKPRGGRCCARSPASQPPCGTPAEKREGPALRALLVLQSLRCLRREDHVGAFGADDVLQLVLKACQRPGLDLPHALPRQAELLADSLERPLLAGEAEPALEHAAVGLLQTLDCAANLEPLQRLVRLVCRVDRAAVGEQVAELTVAVGA